MKIRDLFDVMANSTMVSIQKTVVTDLLYYGKVMACPTELMDKEIFLILPVTGEEYTAIKIALEPVPLSV